MRKPSKKLEGALKRWEEVQKGVSALPDKFKRAPRPSFFPITNKPPQPPVSACLWSAIPCSA